MTTPIPLPTPEETRQMLMDALQRAKIRKLAREFLDLPVAERIRKIARGLE